MGSVLRDDSFSIFRGRVFPVPLVGGQGINTELVGWDISAVYGTMPEGVELALEVRHPRSGWSFPIGSWWLGGSGKWQALWSYWRAADVRYGRDVEVRRSPGGAWLRDGWTAWYDFEIWAGLWGHTEEVAGLTVGYSLRIRPRDGVDRVDLARQHLWATAGGTIVYPEPVHEVAGLSGTSSGPAESGSVWTRVAALSSVVTGSVSVAGIESWEASVGWEARPAVTV